MNFRNATIEDFDEIWQLYNAAIGTEGCTWNEYYPDKELLTQDIQHNNMFCLISDNEIVGSIVIDEDELVDNLPCWSPKLLPCGEIARLVVKETYKNQGIARVLINSVIEKMKERGYLGAHFLVGKNHIRAQRSYAKLCFNPVGEARLFEQDWLCYEKEL